MICVDRKGKKKHPQLMDKVDHHKTYNSYKNYFVDSKAEDKAEDEAEEGKAEGK